jgi:hypothetical protein
LYGSSVYPVSQTPFVASDIAQKLVPSFF